VTGVLVLVLVLVAKSITICYTTYRIIVIVLCRPMQHVKRIALMHRILTIRMSPEIMCVCCMTNAGKIEIP